MNDGKDTDWKDNRENENMFELVSVDADEFHTEYHSCIAISLETIG